MKKSEKEEEKTSCRRLREGQQPRAKKRDSEPVFLLGLSQVVNRQNADRQTDIRLTIRMVTGQLKDRHPKREWEGSGSVGNEEGYNQVVSTSVRPSVGSLATKAREEIL